MRSTAIYDELTACATTPMRLEALVYADPRTGRHLVESMLEPLPEALERLDEFRSAVSSTSGRSASPGGAAPECSSFATRRI